MTMAISSSDILLASLRINAELWNSREREREREREKERERERARN